MCAACDSLQRGEARFKLAQVFRSLIEKAQPTLVLFLQTGLVESSSSDAGKGFDDLNANRLIEAGDMFFVQRDQTYGLVQYEQNGTPNQARGALLK